MTTALELKNKGNQLLSSGDVLEALAAYDRALASASPTDVDLVVALLNNKALCESKLQKHAECEATCARTLEVSPGNPKALYRRAKARIALGKLLDATLDAKTLLSLQPKLPAAVELIQEINKLAKTSETGARKMVSDIVKSTPGGKDDPDAHQLVKNLLHAVHEEEARATEAASDGGALLLLRYGLEKDPLALNVVARLAGVPGPSQVHVLTSLVSDPSIIARLGEITTDSTLDEKHNAAALLVLSRAAQTADKLKSTTTPPTEGLSDLLLLPTPFIRSLSSPSSLVREAAVDACAHLFSSSMSRAKVFCESGGIEALEPVAETDSQLVSMLLGRVLARLTEKSKDNDELVLKHCSNLCNAAFGDAAATIDAKSIARRRTGLCALQSVFQANSEIGLEVVAKRGEEGLAALAEAVTNSPDSTVTVVAEIFALMANTEKGRSTLQDAKSTTALHRLLEHSNPAVRSAASVALTKIEAVHFDADSENGLLVLSSLANLMHKDATPEELRRGLEAVSFVITDTDVKMMLTTGSEGTRILKSLCAAARDKEKDKLNADTAYAIAYILANVTMDEDDKKREKLREMEVSQEQWEKFEEMTKQKSKPGNSRKDSPEEVSIRVDAVVAQGAVPALRSIVMHANATPRVAAEVARAFANMARQQRLRGTMISQGAISALHRAHKLCHDDWAGKDPRKNSGARDAADALARLLITTDPRLLPDAQVMDSIGPLLEQIRTSDEDLVIFECLMALTNLETVSEAAKDKVCSLKGLNTLEFAMFSDDKLVRRAATESMSNLVPADKFIDWLARGDKIRLWILLSEDWETDMQTSRAASGCLAMVASEPRVAGAIRRYGGVERLAQVVKECPHGEIVHRLVVCLASLEGCEPLDEAVAAKDAADHPGGAQVTSEGRKEEQKDAEVVPPEGAQWTPVRGPWTKREGEIVKAVMRDLVKTYSGAREQDDGGKFQPALGIARDWRETQGGV